MTGRTLKDEAEVGGLEAHINPGDSAFLKWIYDGEHSQPVQGHGRTRGGDRMMQFLAEAYIKLNNKKEEGWEESYEEPMGVKVYGFTEGKAVCRLPDGRFRLIPVELIGTKEY